MKQLVTYNLTLLVPLSSPWNLPVQKMDSRR